MSLFWKPGTVAPGSYLDRGADNNLVLSSQPAFSSLSITAQRERLPIFKHRTIRHPNTVPFSPTRFRTKVTVLLGTVRRHPRRWADGVRKNDASVPASS